jgi:hypothetical protein
VLRLPRTSAGRGLLAAALLAVMLGGWWLNQRRNAVQVPATFARLAEAFADNDAAAVIGALHPDYAWDRQWPTVFSHQDELRAMLGGGGRTDSELDRPRGLAKAGIRQWFLLHTLNRLELRWTVHDYTVANDGSITALVDLDLTAANGSTVKVEPLRRHRFILAGYGLGPKLRILSHDPIPVQMPF